MARRPNIIAIHENYSHVERSSTTPLYYEFKCAWIEDAVEALKQEPDLLSGKWKVSSTDDCGLVIFYEHFDVRDVAGMLLRGYWYRVQKELEGQ